ncbi:AraC family transcriptional regulator [Saccharicrinis aurantiacus]|uniref:AraC family transcriptional regulator n=1 Tax=Saccharicrinis aurantiacus TaxID=1849719 RepID=UPI0008383192|nr:AraC family transcriptional regulator [Saccharicrinis aurantiacus]
MCIEIRREITPLKESDCFLIIDRKQNAFNYPVHFHPEFEINFIINGTGSKRIVGDHISEVGEMELVMVGPNLYHGWENGNMNLDSKYRQITIQFSRDLFTNSYLCKKDVKPIKELLNNSCRGISFSTETINKVHHKIIKLTKLEGFEAFLLFQSFLYDIANSANQSFLTNLSFNHENDFYNSERIEKAYKYIVSNFHKKLRLEETAESISMSAITFSRLIKQRTGKSFVDFVNEIRLGYATRHLIESNKTVSEIGYICGFNNLSNFNRIFKKRQGCTPTEFRKDFESVKATA